MGEEKITQEKLKTFLKLEEKTQLMESKVSYKTYKNLERQRNDVHETLEQLKSMHAAQKIKTEKEKKDVEVLNIKDFVTKEAFDQEVSKEKAEYLEAVNKEQLLKTQIEGLTKQHHDIGEEMKNIAPEVEDYEKTRTELDNLLSEIFSGAYGSDLENKLESDYTSQLEKLELVQMAKYKWTNGRHLLHYAHSQLQTATERWASLPKRPDQQGKYQCCTEARNNIVASIQNLKSAQRYLDNIEFPYCNVAEVDTLEKAANNIYVDMMSITRQEYAAKCYISTLKRLGALIQWFDKVLNEVIFVDLKKVLQDERETAKALKLERFRLMKEKLEKDGQKVDIDDSALNRADDSGKDDEGVQLVLLAKPERTTDDECEQQRSTPTPVPLKDLAPPPSKDMVFGNLEKIKDQHKKEMQDLQKTQDMNKARLQQGLEEKLAARRRKRDMQSD